MTEEDFLARWTGERGIYEAWGQHVVSRITQGVGEVATIAADLFLRIPPKARVKADSSILEKAFRRNKNYANPYDEITDKVGARFVVLLGRDISLVSNVIENCPDWKFSRDRDYQKEQESRPIQFEYAAVHYVVRCANDLQLGEYVVPANAPCEVQVKTILQHAYSELTHDTIYKPSLVASPDMVRTAAKSMALLEATGDYFERVVTLVEAETMPAKGLSVELGSLYKKAVGQSPEVTRAEGIILEAFGDDLGSDAVARTEQLLMQKSFIGGRIKARSVGGLIYRQPSILVVYLVAFEQPAMTKNRWPFVEDELRPIYTDLGIAFEGR